MLAVSIMVLGFAYADGLELVLAVQSLPEHLGVGKALGNTLEESTSHGLGIGIGSPTRKREREDEAKGDHALHSKRGIRRAMDDNMIN